MANSYLTTRIILRNDGTTQWNSNSSQVLYRGEVGIEFLENGKVKMKVGDGTKTWAQLPYFGGDECKVTEIEVAKGVAHSTSLNAIVNPNKGDIAIVKEAIIAESLLSESVTQKHQYTAYVYGDTANGTAWKAMDGNYSAENVYFDEDLTYTANIGVLSLGSKKSDKLSAAGKSLEQVMKSIMAKTVNGSKTDPSFTLDEYTATYSDLEVGNYITKLNYKTSFTDGKYSQGTVTNEAGAGYTTTQSAGCTPSYVITNSVDSQENNAADSNFTLSGNGVQIDSTDQKTYATITAKCTYTAASKLPANNLGEYDSSCTKITANTTGITKTGDIKLTGYRKMFFRTFTVSETKDGAPSYSDGTAIRNTLGYTGRKYVGNKIADASGKLQDTLVFSIPDNTKYMVLCLPKGKKVTYAKETASNFMQDFSGGFTKKATVTIPGANNFTGIEYDVYEWTTGGWIDSNTFHIKMGS